MRILVVPGFAKEAQSANTNCVDEIIDALNRLPDVDVMTTGAVMRSLRAGVKWKQNKGFMIRKVWNWPVIDPDASDECYRQIKEMVEKYSFDAILVAHMPYDAVLAALRVKRENPDILLMLYELDPITYEIDRNRKSPGKYLYFLRERAETRTYRSCDVIFHMECNRRKYEAPEYAKYRAKGIYLDFPLIHDRHITGSPGKTVTDKPVQLIYAGKLMKHFRSPEYLLNVLVETSKRISMNAEFYSGGDCEEMLRNYADRYPFIHANGYIPKPLLDSKLSACDFLINISNKVSEMLPSKLLTYIETGAPVIHVSNQTNDTCVRYLQKYDNSLIISETDPVSVSAGKLCDFIHTHYERRIPSETVLKTFEANRADYSAYHIAEFVRSCGNANR